MTKRYRPLRALATETRKRRQHVNRFAALVAAARSASTLGDLAALESEVCTILKLWARQTKARTSGTHRVVRWEVRGEKSSAYAMLNKLLGVIGETRDLAPELPLETPFPCVCPPGAAVSFGEVVNAILDGYFPRV